MLISSEAKNINLFNNPFKLVSPDRFELLYLFMWALFDTRGMFLVYNNIERVIFF